MCAETVMHNTDFFPLLLGEKKKEKKKEGVTELKKKIKK